jgi:hypothetical protein
MLPRYDPDADVPGSNVEILPNGKKRYLRATRVDLALCLLLPAFGLLIALFAVLRGEKKRAETMFLLSLLWIVVFTVLRYVLRI